VSLLSRRDEQTASDHITVMIDSYHDRRTGFEFSVNPAGVKCDYAIYNDGNEDSAWDAVWDAATRSTPWMDGRVSDPVVSASLLLQAQRDLRAPDLEAHRTECRGRHLAALSRIGIRTRIPVRGV
jgi:hypothetical protein